MARSMHDRYVTERQCVYISIQFFVALRSSLSAEMAAGAVEQGTAGKMPWRIDDILRSQPHISSCFRSDRYAIADDAVITVPGRGEVKMQVFVRNG